MSRLMYVVGNRFKDFSLYRTMGPGNAGGGVATKVMRVAEILRGFYDVDLIGEFSVHDTASILMLDPLAIRLARDSENMLDAYENHTANLKVLYCSEQAFLELSSDFRERLYKASSVVTTCSDFQELQFNMIGYPSVRLCDPIPDIFYSPDTSKMLSVVSMGHISHFKNIPMLIEIYKLLYNAGVKTIYVGGSALWGDLSVKNRSLELELRRYCREFERNVPQYQVARILSKAAMGVCCSFHETASEGNQEGNMAGVWWYCGDHRLWKERPGRYGLRSPKHFFEVMSKDTDGFNRVPAAAKRVKAEKWALDHCSTSAFLKQWEEVVTYANW